MKFWLKHEREKPETDLEKTIESIMGRKITESYAELSGGRDENNNPTLKPFAPAGEALPPARA